MPCRPVAGALVLAQISVGRDVFSRVIVATGFDLVYFVAAVCAFFRGLALLLGVLPVTGGGWLDAVLNRVLDTNYGLSPCVVLAMGIVLHSAWQYDFENIIYATAIINVPSTRGWCGLSVNISVEFPGLPGCQTGQEIPISGCWGHAYISQCAAAR